MSDKNMPLDDESVNNLQCYYFAPQTRRDQCVLSEILRCINAENQQKYHTLQPTKTGDDDNKVQL